jgi:hypothetical protein
MKNGGRRPGAGRKKGVPNKATIARQERVAAGGETPLDYMLRVMRNPKASDARRDEMAKAAAPYVHPKLASMQHTGRNGGPIQHVDLTKVSDDDLSKLERIFGPLAGSDDDDAPDQGGEGAAAGRG